VPLVVSRWCWQRRIPIVAAIAFALPCKVTAQRSEPLSGTSNAAPAGSAEVQVTRAEVRVLFAVDSSRQWGWPASADSVYRVRYVWSATIEGSSGPRSFDLIVKARDTLASAFPSLDSLVQSGTTSLCQPGMMVQCFPATVSASVQDRRIVLRYRDSAEIARIFSIRPASATIMTETPNGSRAPTLSTAAVRYLEPALPPLDSLGRSEALRTRRSYDASVNRMYRHLSGARWIEEGDSAQFGIEETHCLEDACTPYHAPRDAPRTWGTWSSSDTTVAHLHRTTGKIDDWRLSRDSDRVMTLVALKSGRTTIRASGVHDPADLEPSRIPVDSIVTGEVVVTPRVGRLVISPRPTTMRAGELQSFSVRVVDRAGRVIEGTPVQLRWGKRATEGETARMGFRRLNAQKTRPATNGVALRFDQPGRYEIIAGLGVIGDPDAFPCRYADTVNVDVVDMAKR
jgi:hypothetical protein